MSETDEQPDPWKFPHTDNRKQDEKQEAEE